LSQEQLTILLLAIVSVYFAGYLVLSIGVWRARRTIGRAAEHTTELPTATVLVCARDEEDNIDACVRSLSQLDYPEDKLQLLFVDDKSTDRTPEILADWQARLPNLTVHRTGPEIEHLKGKVNALTQGMDVATGEYVLITDADSHVDPNWAREYVRHYERDTGMVASITLLDEDSFFDSMQSLDWAYLLGMAAAGANLNAPISVIGNNMSVRREAYESVGGYRKIPFSITEDQALMKAIWYKRPWKVKFRVHPDLTVMSKATPTFKAWWRQKHRWVKGGEDLKAYGYLIFGIGLLGNLSMFLAPFILPAFAAVMVILIKWAADLLIIVPVLTKLRKTHLLRYFPVYELYLALFVFSMPIMIMQKNVVWKGRVYKH
jgi:cellulose synthase/poly-beta-1,6-N-acetylglucosamine synthase-like glycosyltransferase